VPPVSLGPAGEELPRSLLDGDEDVRLFRCESRGCRRSTGACAWPGWADLRPGHDPYIQANGSSSGSWRASRAGGGAGRGARHARSLRQRWAETTDGRRLRRLRGPPGHAGARPRRVPAARPQVQDAEPGQGRNPVLTPVPERAARGPAGAWLGGAVAGRAGEILDELAAGWSRRLIDVMPTIGRLIFQRGFDPQIDYDESRWNGWRAAMERHPGIFLWSHRSNLDTLVLAAAMQELGLPPAHLFAGINMAFGRWAR